VHRAPILLYVPAVASFAELAEQVVGLERWAADLDRRSSRLLSGMPSVTNLDALAEEYAALADEGDAVCAEWEALAGSHDEQTRWLRQLSVATRERCRQHRLQVAAMIRGRAVPPQHRPSSHL
jgi:hypothetical protein